MKIEHIDDPTDDQIEAVNVLLRDHNRGNNSVYWEALGDEANAAQPLRLFMQDDEGQIVAGLFGETRFKWLKINIMAVKPDHRRQGLGLQLLKQAEMIAEDRGCIHVYVDTMEYQAPEFYVKAGYCKNGHLPDWDSHGNGKYLFTKEL